MSKRPHVVDAHEKEAERETQRRRKDRDREISARSGGAKKSKTTAEPFIRSRNRGAPAGDIPKKIARWIEGEDRDQMRHYERIYREMEKLEPVREQWTAEFLDRITGPRGFSVHAGQRRTIRKDELPKRPDRPWRVVW